MKQTNFYNKKNNTVELVQSNFQKNKVQWNTDIDYKDNAGFIFIYTTWCETCHTMKDWYENLADYWKYDFHMGAVNAMDIKHGNDELTAKMGIQGFPVFYSVDIDGTIRKLDVILNCEMIYESMLNKVDEVRGKRTML